MAEYDGLRDAAAAWRAGRAADDWAMSLAWDLHLDELHAEALAEDKRRTRTRVNAKGKLIRSNYGIEWVYESRVRCLGCGREFSVSDMRKPSNYWPSRDGARYEALNRARAQRHADRCRGKAP